jgi:hypothetical protein
MLLNASRAVLVGALWLVPSLASAQVSTTLTAVKDLVPWTDVRFTGAYGNGTHDDTAAIQKAIDTTGAGGVVFFPRGRYLVSNEFVINKAINLQGVGFGSQIFQSASGKNLFVFNAVQAVEVKDLYLGSAATVQGTSLMQLLNTHHSRFDRVIMRGAYYGVHLRGALLNTFIDLKSGINIGGFFAPTSDNQYWVFGERANGKSCNANTFLAPTLEGGTNGIRLEDTNGEGSLFVYGGTIEGVSNYGLSLQGTGLPSIVSGLHLEANLAGDILLDTSNRVRLQSVLATTRIEIAGTSTNNVISDSMVEKIVIPATAVRTRLSSLAMNPSGSTAHPVEDNATDTEYMNVSEINAFDWYGTVGIGRPNPNSNPVGLTPNRKLDVSGLIRGTGFETGDIHFYKDGQQLWRMYENEQGLQLENAKTGAVSRVFLENDISPIVERLSRQEDELNRLRLELEGLKR